jgi:predicted O-methyltransferase YrrM
MHYQSPDFISLLGTAQHHATTYVQYSPDQIAKSEHIHNDPRTGERAWSIPETTGKFLYDRIMENNFQNGLELGTSIGYSTLWIASALTENNPNAPLITIEKNGTKSSIAQSYLCPMFAKNIIFHTGRIGEILPTINYPLDFIFMDADRGNYRTYWEYIFPLLHKKSMVIIDNANRVQKSVQEFQDFLREDDRISVTLNPMDNGLLIITLAT